MANLVISTNTFNLDQEEVVKEMIGNYSGIKDGKIENFSPIHFAIEQSESYNSLFHRKSN